MGCPAMLARLCLAAGCLAAAAAEMIVDLQPHGDHSIRVRVAPAGGAIVDPPAMALLFTPPPHSTAVARPGPHALTNGNLKVEVEPRRPPACSRPRGSPTAR